MNSVKIHDLKQKVYLGVTDEERSSPQIVIFNIELEIDTAACVKSDALSDTVDYIGVMKLIDGLAREYRWNLLEKLAFDIGQSILAAFPRVLSVTIESTKNVTPNSSGFSARLHLPRN